MLHQSHSNIQWFHCKHRARTIPRVNHKALMMIWFVEDDPGHQTQSQANIPYGMKLSKYCANNTVRNPSSSRPLHIVRPGCRVQHSFFHYHTCRQWRRFCYTIFETKYNLTDVKTMPSFSRIKKIVGQFCVTFS